MTTKKLETVPGDAEILVEKVRERYAGFAEGQGSCCSSCGSESELARRIGYEGEQLEGAAETANLGLGCGAPIPLLNLVPGEVLLDLGSGAGLDAVLAAGYVGPQGKVIGVDMTPEMIRRARENTARAGLEQIEFREGRLENLPLGDAEVDAVTSNCVINLVPDKGRVFREIARVLRPGGRLVIADIVLDGELPEVLRKDLLAYVGCLSGAMRREAYFGALRAGGLGEIRVLRDVDYLAALDGLLPDEVTALLAREGIGVAEIEGVVRSVTFSATRR